VESSILYLVPYQATWQSSSLRIGALADSSRKLWVVLVFSAQPMPKQATPSPLMESAVSLGGLPAWSSCSSVVPWPGPPSPHLICVSFWKKWELRFRISRQRVRPLLRGLNFRSCPAEVARSVGGDYNGVWIKGSLTAENQFMWAFVLPDHQDLNAAWLPRDPTVGNNGKETRPL